MSIVSEIIGIDHWEIGNSNFHSKIIGKSDIIIVIETTEGKDYLEQILVRI